MFEKESIQRLYAEDEIRPAYCDDDFDIPVDDEEHSSEDYQMNHQQHNARKHNLRRLGKPTSPTTSEGKRDDEDEFMSAP